MHAAYSYEIVKNIPGFDEEMCKAILMHHEREDGSGYLLGLKENAINEYAKIIAVADVFDAMTSDRTYKLKVNAFDVFEFLEEQSPEKLNFKITSTFLKNAANYYIGDKFFLNSGEICEIIFINPSYVSKPLVRVGDRYIDLSKDPTIRIEGLV